MNYITDKAREPLIFDPNWGEIAITLSLVFVFIVVWCL